MSSEWLGRLWTLHEGRLTSNLYIRFRYQAIFMNEFTGSDFKLHLCLDSDIFGGLYFATGTLVDIFR